MAKNRFEWLMVVSQLLAQLSDKMTSLGLIWFITTQFGESWLTWYLVVGGLPHLIFAGFSGSWIQKMGALNTVVYADFFRAILFGVSAYFFNETISETTLYFIVSLIFVSNIASAFFNPAILTLPLELEQGDRIQLLTARLTTITSLTTVIGPIVGLFCFNQFGIKGLFFISFLSYLISGFCAFELTKMSLGKENANLEKDAEIISIPVFKSLRRNHLITVMLGVFLFMNLFLSPLQVLMPAMAKNLFNKSFNSLAYMEVVFGVGIVMGGVLLSVFTIKRKELYWVWGLLVAFSVSYLFFHYQDKLLMNLLFLFMMGLTLGLVNVLIIHLFQERPLKEDVANIMSVTNLISTASVPFSLTMLALMQRYLTVEKLGLFSSIGLVIIVVLAYYPFARWGKEIFK
jgi:MFS family permease